MEQWQPQSRLMLTHDYTLTKESIFLVLKCFSLLMFCVVWDYSYSELKSKQYKRKKNHRKVTKLHSKFSLTLG